jgi:antitoxin component YwqK of YwqJK toxin-antitoxin module
VSIRIKNVFVFSDDQFKLNCIHTEINLLVMRKVLINMIYSLLVSTGIAAQKIDTLYFTLDWRICIKPQANYYRVSSLMVDSSLHYKGKVMDYYVDGTAEMEGNYSDAGTKAGVFTFYYPNGKIKETGNYANDFQSGFWDYYFPNGKKKATIYFAGDGDSFSVLDFFSASGNVLAKDGTGIFYWAFPGEPSYEVEGEFENEMRQGIWKYYLIQGQNKIMVIREEYEKGKLKKNTYPANKSLNGKSEMPPLLDFSEPQVSLAEEFTGIEALDGLYFLSDSEKKILAQKDSSTVYGIKKDSLGMVHDVEISAAFPGGDNAWKRYLATHLDYDLSADLPASVKKFSQTVYVQFIVDTDGTITDIQITNKDYVNPRMKKAIINVIARSGKWMPAIQNGRAVKAYRTQPITLAYESL